MKELTYIAVMEPTTEGLWVYFPDVLGCTSFGATLKEAEENAKEALGLHLYAMEKDGEQLPETSDRPEIDPETEAGYFLVPITIYPDLIKTELDNKKVKTNVTISNWLKELAEAENVNFSCVLETALREMFKGQTRK